MKVFDKAILRLTAIYSGILLAICVGFSVVIYTGATRSFADRPIDRRPDFVLEVNDEIEVLIRERDSAIQRQLLVQLIIVNICVFGTGVFASYFLAKLTLKPIHENMKTQAEFVSNASHELRTPLNTMRMENEVLRRDPKATREEYIDLVDSNLEEIGKLSALCTSLLSLSRNEMLLLTNVELPPVIEETVAKIMPLAAKKKIKIVRHVKTEKIEANPEALAEIMTVLLENAIKYSPEKSKISIVADGHKVQIIDQGSGIAPEDLPHIFERFYRAEKSHTTSGHGLGLAIARHLALQQNLKITASNNDKKGATFTIS